MRSLVRALLTVVSLGAAAAANAATVTGNVTRAGSPGPLPGMVVAAYDPAGNLRGTASTDATGLYVLTIPAGDYRLLAYDPAGVYATMFDGNAESFETTTLRTIPAGGAQVSFALVRGGVVMGRVLTANGLPLGSSAVVEAYNLSGTRRGFTTANGSGDYSLVLPPGDYKLVAYDANGFYALAFHPGAHSFAEATPVHVIEGVTASVGFLLVVAGRLSGTTVDAVTRLPLPSIRVFVYTLGGALVTSTTTDSAGVFRFSLPPGGYRIVAADAARIYATAYFDGKRSFDAANVVALAAGQLLSVQVALARGAHISGRVNAPNLTVAAYNIDGTLHAATTSDAAGNYTLVVAPGDYRIAVSDPALTYAALFYGGTTDFRFAQKLSVGGNVSGIDVTLPRGGRVSGTVRNGSTLQPLGGMTVAAYDAAGMQATSAVTGSDGRYALVVAPGTYRFVAFDARLEYATSYAGGATSYETTGPLAVEAEAAITADFVMRRGVRVSGTVLSDRGAMLTGVEVFALDESGNRAAGAVSKDGAFTIVVTPGTYRFLAVDPFRRFASNEPSPEVAIVEGQTSPAIALMVTTVPRRRAVRH